MPAARAIDSWPTSVSTQPRLPQAHRWPSGVDRHVAELAAEAVGAAKQAAAEHDAAAHADLAEDADEVVDPDGRPRPVLGERGEVRLVLDVDGKPEPGLELGSDRDVLPAEVRREARRCRTPPRRGPGTATEIPTGRRPSSCAASRAVARGLAEPVEHGAAAPSRGCRDTTRRS